MSKKAAASNRLETAYKARIRFPAFLSETDIEALTGAAAEEAGALSAFREHNTDQDPWIVEFIMQTKPELPLLASRIALMASLKNFKGINLDDEQWTIEEVPPTDWLARSYRQFAPFSVGRYFIYGSHYDGMVPDGQTGLQIDAATAFGSGEHGTTAGCLLAMEDLQAQGVCPWNVLEMGTGSGILAIAAWKTWKTPVLAVDNDAEAVRVAAHHRDANRVPDGPTGMMCAEGDGFNTPQVTARGPYDLIVANILASVLKDMAEALKTVSDENGYVVLSGILTTQAEEVLAVYSATGFAPVKTFVRGEWTTLVLQKKS